MELRELVRMTRTKMIAEAMKIPDVSGAHGMKKEELVRVLARSYGIDLEGQAGEQQKKTIWEIKKRIQELKVQRQGAEKIGDRKKALLLRKQLKGLKHRTRVLARQIKPKAA
jgi:hypothetical protein